MADHSWLDEIAATDADVREFRALLRELDVLDFIHEHRHDERVAASVRALRLLDEAARLLRVARAAEALLDVDPDPLTTGLLGEDQATQAAADVAEAELRAALRGEL